MVQIISPVQDKYIKRTPDGTPMEVALTRGLSHPNIVRALRHASFNSQVHDCSPFPQMPAAVIECNSDFAKPVCFRAQHLSAPSNPAAFFTPLSGRAARLAVCLELHFTLHSTLGAGLDVMTISLQLQKKKKKKKKKSQALASQQCLHVSLILFLVLQNASLAVLQDTEVGSMDSWDSSWDQEDLEPSSRHSSRQHPEVNQETWLMLEYCDKGSLLVSKLPPGGMGDACRV